MCEGHSYIGHKQMNFSSSQCFSNFSDYQSHQASEGDAADVGTVLRDSGLPHKPGAKVTKNQYCKWLDCAQSVIHCFTHVSYLPILNIILKN